MAKEGNPLWSRYRHLLRRRTTDDVQDELRFHVDMRIEEARRAGLREPDARAAALERFGRYTDVENEVLNIDRARERRRRRTEWFGDLRQDVAFAIRSLTHAPSFAIAAVATLAIAIGANTMIFSLVNALLLQPLPYAEPQQLVSMWGYSTGELLQLREHLRSASDIAAYRATSANLDDGASAERLDGSVVSANLFALLRASARIGRTFAADEGDRGKTDVVILGNGLWQRRFAGDSSVIGRRVLIDGSSTMIIGVMPADFAFPTSTTDFWKPLLIDRSDVVSLWAGGASHFIGRLRAGTTVAAARRELQQLAPTFRHANTIWDPGPMYGQHADVQSLQASMLGGTRPVLMLLLGCVVVVLVIACVNVANLLLARASARERELAVRAALGGGRGRLIRQLLTESLVLAGVGGAIGVLLSAAGIRWLVASLPAGVPRTNEIALSGTTLAFTLGLTMLTGVAFGLLPALRATSGRGGGETARSGRTGRGVGHHRISSMLIIGEVALAVLLVIGAELLVRSFGQMRRLDPGFRIDHLVTARVTPAPANYADASKTNALYGAILSRAAALPGVENVAGVSDLPIARPVYAGVLRIEGQFEDMKHNLPSEDHSQVVTPDYFTTMRIPIIRGRAFTDADHGGTQPVAIVSQSMARRFWPGGDAIGKRVGYPWESPWMTIVGVVADVRSDSLRDTSAVSVYFPFLQRAKTARPEFTILLRTASDPTIVERSLRAVVADVDRAVPLSEVRTMDDVIAQSLAKPRFIMLLVGAFAIVALFLGAVGIYGVMSYLVSQRMQEMGIRMALGATAPAVLTMVVRRAAVLAGTGAVIGVAAAFVAMRPLRALLFGVSIGDPLTVLSVPILFVIVAMVASFVPALRATRVSPVTVLRAD
ncbi:MAG TPA: ABC transporter permease [Gemmatimonadaceae bacterium]|nr:ABC transporter permease [Gemmatimonadaceae bacterium]